MIKWLIMAYVFIVYCAEELYLEVRCYVGRPAVYNDYPHEGTCKNCGLRH